MEEDTTTMGNPDKLRKEEDSNDNELTATGGKGQRVMKNTAHTRAEQSNENDEMAEDTPTIGNFDEDFYRQEQESNGKKMDESEQDETEQRNKYICLTEENLERKTSQHDIQICLDPSDSKSSTTSTQLKTKHAACVSKVLGTTEKVINLMNYGTN